MPQAPGPRQLSVSVGFPVLTLRGNGSKRHVTFFVRLLSLSIVLSRPVCVSAGVRASFLFPLRDVPRHGCVPFASTHPLVGTWVVPLVAVRTGAARSTCVHVSGEECFLSSWVHTEEVELQTVPRGALFLKSGLFHDGDRRATFGSLTQIQEQLNFFRAYLFLIKQQ